MFRHLIEGVSLYCQVLDGIGGLLGLQVLTCAQAVEGKDARMPVGTVGLVVYAGGSTPGGGRPSDHRGQQPHNSGCWGGHPVSAPSSRAAP